MHRACKGWCQPAPNRSLRACDEVPGAYAEWEAISDSPTHFFWSADSCIQPEERKWQTAFSSQSVSTCTEYAMRDTSIDQVGDLTCGFVFRKNKSKRIGL